MGSVLSLYFYLDDWKSKKRNIRKLFLQFFFFRTSCKPLNWRRAINIRFKVTAKTFFRFVLGLKFPPKTFSIHFCKSYRWMVCATIWVSDYFIIKRSGFTKVNALICVQILEQFVTHNFHSRISSIKTTYVNTKQCGKWNLIRSQNWNEKLWFQSLWLKTNWFCDLKAFG